MADCGVRLGPRVALSKSDTCPIPLVRNNNAATLERYCSRIIDIPLSPRRALIRNGPLDIPNNTPGSIYFDRLSRS